MLIKKIITAAIGIAILGNVHCLAAENAQNSTNPLTAEASVEKSRLGHLYDATWYAGMAVGIIYARDFVCDQESKKCYDNPPSDSRGSVVSTLINAPAAILALKAWQSLCAAAGYDKQPTMTDVVTKMEHLESKLDQLLNNKGK